MADLYNQVLEYFQLGGTLGAYTIASTNTYTTKGTSQYDDYFRYYYRVGDTQPIRFSVEYMSDYRADGEMIAV